MELVADILAVSVRGVISLDRVVRGIASLAKYLRDATRRRRPQNPRACPLFRTHTATGPPIGT